MMLVAHYSGSVERMFWVDDVTKSVEECIESVDGELRLGVVKWEWTRMEWL